jgi:methylthioribose-1-phosphate isomerase
MASQIMREGKIDLVITGADRIAENGDAANKIGTYGVAVLAKYHGVPFYIAAPKTTFDQQCPSGKDIPIEQRNPNEVKRIFGRQSAPQEADAYNPAFDVTPHELISGIISEEGIWTPNVYGD